MKNYLKSGFYNLFTSNYKTDEQLLIRRLILINTFLIAGTITFVTVFILNTFIRPNPAVALLDAVAGITFFSTFVDLRINKQEKRAIFITLLSLTLFTFYFVSINHDSNFGLIWTIFIPLLAITLYGYKIGGYIALIYYFFMFTLVIYGLYAWNSVEWNIVAVFRFIIASSVFFFVVYITEHSFNIMQNALNRLTITDPLTQLFNRRKTDEVIQKSLDTMQRNPTPLSLIIFDIDDFKAVNDTYGHLIGDEVLQTLSQILKKNIRDIDTVGRWGGEEFIIVLPQTSKIDALKSLERLKNAINTCDFKTVGHITCSYGLCSMDHLKFNRDELITHADNALYNAKESGKNCICIAEAST